MYFIRVDFLAKSRLRALNTTNDSVVPIHNDLKIKSLQKSWKIWYKIFNSLLLTQNNKIKLQKTVHKTTISSDHYRTRKLKHNIFASRLFFGKKSAVIVNKKYLTNIKVVLADNNVFIVCVMYPLYSVTTNLRTSQYCVKKKKMISKFKLNKRAKLKNKKGRRNSFIKSIKNPKFLTKLFIC